MVDTGFEELDFHEDELVVEALKLTQQGVDEGEGFVIGLLRHMEGDEASFKVLAEERAALGNGPFYT